MKELVEAPRTRVAPQEELQRRLSTALEAYYVDQNAYPTNLDQLFGPVQYIDQDTLSAAKQYLEYEMESHRGWPLGTLLQYSGSHQFSRANHR